MEDPEGSADWEVVGTKKEKKGSPKAEKRKGTKRTEIQRSTSLSQMPKRKTVVVPENGSRPTTRSSTKPKLSEEDIVKSGDKSDAKQEALTTSIEDVSSKIQFLTISEAAQPQASGESGKRKEVSFSATVGSATQVSSTSLSSHAFCELCRSFDTDVFTATHFQTRSLINTGSACFCNCVMQALFALEAFQRLLSSILERLKASNAQLDTSLRCWSEVVQLAEEFYIAPEVPNGSALTPAPAKASPTKDEKAAAVATAHAEHEATALSTPTVRTSARRTAVAATALMPSLFQTFIQKMDSISGVRTTTNGKKNNQQDAVEFLTFLLDALHEEILQAEQVHARQAEEAKVAALTKERTSPQLGGVANMSTDDYDLIALNSRQNSFDMVIAMSRQNSLTTEAQKTAAVEVDEGWSTVSKGSKGKAKSVVVDAVSKERAESASTASVISRLFHATLRSEVVYKVKKMNSVTFQRFHCLTLDIGTGGFTGSISLETCLATYFAEESIDDGKVKKQLKLDSLPEVLILQLSRFSFDYLKMVPIKILKNVEYPATLTLSPQILSDELKQRAGTPRYQLQAVVLHHGKKATGGHYSAFTLEVQRRSSSGGSGSGNSGGSGEERSALRDTHIWRSVNDAKVNTVSESQVLGAQDVAYILFYGRVRE